MNPFSNDFLDSMREVADPLADKLVADTLVAGGVPLLLELNNWLQDFNNREVPANMPASVQNFFNEDVVYPPWVDHDLLKEGTRLFERFAIPTIIVLFLRSLAQYFANADSNHAFLRADFLNPQTVPRFMIEIAQLIIDIVKPGGLDVSPEKGDGVYAVQKLRVHHAFLRYMVVVDPCWDEPKLDPHLGPWNPAWGKPLNQEDEAGAVMAFSLWTLQGLVKLAVVLDDKEKDGVYMIWRVTGWLLGVQEELLPETREEGLLLLDAIGVRQFRSSRGGTKLVRRLIHVVQLFLPWIYSGLPIVLMRYLMDPVFVKMLRVPRILSPFWFFGSLWRATTRDLRLMRNITTDISDRFLRGLDRVGTEKPDWGRRRLRRRTLSLASIRQGARGPFRVPETFLKFKL